MTPHGNYEKITKTNENPQYWSKGGIMGTYQKKSTETCVLKPILVGEKKIFFFDLMSFFGRTSDFRARVTGGGGI